MNRHLPESPPKEAKCPSPRLRVRVLAASGILAALAAGVWMGVVFLGSNTPRARSLDLAAEVSRLLADSRAVDVARHFHLPPSASSRSEAELAQWMGDALRDEISDEGLRELRRHGQFGPLAEIFPDQSALWATVFDVPVGECVAFRMERGGVTAELVLHQGPEGLRILRCNNVKQMAPNALN